MCESNHDDASPDDGEDDARIIEHTRAGYFRNEILNCNLVSFVIIAIPMGRGKIAI